MARSARRSRAPRVKRDWVYTQQGYAVDPFFLASSSANSLAIPLTISQNARREIAFGAPGIEPTWADVAQVQSGAAFPEGANQRIYAVDGCIMVTVNDWALATFFRLGMRLMHGVMGNFDGQLSVEAGYSMWEQTTPEDLNQWANAGYLREWYKAETWQGAAGGLVSRTAYVYPVRWRSQKGVRLGNDRALFLYLETDINSRELSVFSRLRTQVSVTAP